MAVLLTPTRPFLTDSSLSVPSVYVVIEFAGFSKTQRSIQLQLRFFASEAAAKPEHGARAAMPLTLVDVPAQLTIVKQDLVSLIYTGINEKSFAQLAYEQVMEFFTRELPEGAKVEAV
jgi:hypothetical protein